jgi:hypothetical protein
VSVGVGGGWFILKSSEESRTMINMGNDTKISNSIRIVLKFGH